MLADRADEVFGQLFALIDITADLADPALLRFFLLGRSRLNICLIIIVRHRLYIIEHLRLGAFHKYHAKQAGVDKVIRFEVANAINFTSEKSYGVLVSNPPYGERLSGEKEVQSLMRSFGKTFRALLDWNAYILTSLPQFERYFGKTADKKKKLYNANLVCGLYAYFGKPPKLQNPQGR